MKSTLGSFPSRNANSIGDDRGATPNHDAGTRPAVVPYDRVATASHEYDGVDQHVTATACGIIQTLFHLAASDRSSGESTPGMPIRLVDNPIDLLDPSGEDFIALGDEPIYDFATDFFLEQAVTVGWYHYDLTYWKTSCTSTGQIEVKDFKKAHPDAQLAEGVELIPTWNVVAATKDKPGVTIPWTEYLMGSFGPRYPNGGGEVTPAIKTMFPGVTHLWGAAVSTIQFNANPKWIKSIFKGTPAQVKTKWDQVRTNANKYPYAENGKAPYRFPDSEWTKFGNNSNTFIRWLMKESGFGSPTLSGLHGGNDLPVDYYGTWKARFEVIGMGHYIDQTLIKGI